MIKVENLSFSYPRRRVRVFEHTSLTLTQGSVTGLLGKNGTGKTTLLKLITGLLTPASGSATIDGERASDRQPTMLSKLFLLPEEFALPRVTPLEYAVLYGKFYPEFSDTEFEQLLTELEVSGNEKFHNMSFGQRKKGYIAFALACNTPYIFMDEPTNGLDIPSKAVFRRLVARKAVADRTIVISTHQVRDLEELIDHILILDGHEFLLDASVTEITRKLRFERVEDINSALYAEKTIAGTVGVTLNNDPNSETGLDIELLFNAATTSRAAVKELFKKQ